MWEIACHLVTEVSHLSLLILVQFTEVKSLILKLI